MIDVNPNNLDMVTRILAGHVPECEVRAFGSRVSWTAKDYSDLDLVVAGKHALDSDVLRRLREAFEESDLPFRVDVLDWHAIGSAFQKVIEKKYEVVQRGVKKGFGVAVEELVGALPAGWEYTTLGEVCARGGGNVQTGPFGTQLHAADYVSRGVPSIMPQNIGDNRVIRDGIAQITVEDAERLSKYLVRPGDVAYSRRGDVERRALIRDVEDGWLCGTGCLRVRFGDGHVNPTFASYYLGEPNVREWVVRHAHGATMSNLNTAILSALPFVLPPPLEQRAIAHILGTLDDKIDLNRRMNETLEAMARALFKSWFVDFDPVRAKAEGRDPGLPKRLADLYPDSFDDSELGEIPKGWKLGRFGDVVEQLRIQENPLSSPNVLFHHFSIPSFDEGQSPILEFGESIKSIKTGVPAGVILLSKLNPEIERVWMVDVRPGERAVCSTEFLVLHALSPFTRSYVYCLARSSLFRQQIEGLVTGTSKSHQRAQVDSVLKLAVVVPPSSIVAAFDHSAHTLLARTLACRRESHTLTALRDTLLPKLISGELRLKDAEQKAEIA